VSRSPGEPSPGVARPATLWDRVEGFERLLEHRCRLGIAVLLARHEALSFTRLRDLLGETDGALGAHLSKLEAAGHLEVEKSFEGRRPISWYRLTRAGRRVLEAHLTALEALVSAAAPPADDPPDEVDPPRGEDP
jgi:predicted ArsR family transcriptional regulator